MSVKFQDYYETLGVPRTASKDEIQRAYRKLAKQYHPDVNKAKDAEDRFKEIGEADDCWCSRRVVEEVVSQHQSKTLSVWGRKSEPATERQSPSSVGLHKCRDPCKKLLLLIQLEVTLVFG